MAGKVTTQLVIEGKNLSKAAFDEVMKDLGRLNSSMEKVGKAAAGALSFGVLAGATRRVVETADSYQLMNARLKLATSSQEEFNLAQAELQRIAAATGSPVSSLVDLYGRISRPLKEAGKSQQDILGVTEAVATAFRVSGASAAEAENGVVQFAQALGSGALRGDEFNSVAEQAPRLMQALADGIGQPVGALKELASEGKLTADVVTTALIGQLPKLQDELAGFGDTVGKEVTAIGDTLERGFGNAATGPLVEALKELREALNDPQMQQNLTTLASALVRLAQGAVKGGAAVAGVGDDLGYIAARLVSGVAELERANKEIEVLEAAAGDNFGLVDLYMSDEAIEKKLKEFRDYRERLIEEMTGMTEEARKQAKEQAEAEKRADDDRHQAGIRSEQAYITSIRNIRQQRITDIEDEIKALEKQEKAALRVIEDSRQKRLDIEKRYSDAIRKFRQGDRPDDFGTVTDLQLSARQALQAGDAETATKQAQEALGVLQELAKSGQNTYGFEGVAKQLKAIELAALDIEKSKSDEKVAEITDQLRALGEEAASLQNIPITFSLDSAEVERVKSMLQELSSTPIFVPVKVVPPAEMGAPGVPTAAGVSFPGFAKGTRSAPPGMAWVGENGPELLQFNGGERVFTADASRNLMQRLAGMRIPDLASGSFVDTAAAAGGGNKGTVVLDLGGGRSYSLEAAELTFDDILRNEARKSRRRRS